MSKRKDKIRTRKYRKLQKGVEDPYLPVTSYLPSHSNKFVILDSSSLQVIEPINLKR